MTGRLTMVNCSECNKLFVRPPLHKYIIRGRGKTKTFCRYNCYVKHGGDNYKIVLKSTKKKQQAAK